MHQPRAPRTRLLGQVLTFALLAAFSFVAALARPCFAAPPTDDGPMSTPAVSDVQIVLDFPHDLARLPLGVTDTVRVRVIDSKGPPTYDYYGSRRGPMHWRLIPARDGRTVATMDEDGNITTVAAGQVEIELSYLGHVTSTTLTVFDEPPTKLEISPLYETVELGEEAQFEATAEYDFRPWNRTEAVTWTATDVGSDSQVVSIDSKGRMHALHLGVAEIAATLSSKRVATRVMVVPRSRTSARAAGNRSFTPPAVYRMCRARLRELWLPRLRALSGLPVKLRGHVERRSADLGIDVGGEDGPGIEIFWDPEKCEGAIAGWSGSFDWRAPSTPLEELLAFAGYDCISFNVR